MLFDIGNESYFLIAIGLIWISFAVFQDLRRREVDNIVNFSLIAIALFYRLSVSIFNGNYWFFYNGLIGFVVFLVLGNLFYYSRLFAGGDAKLLISLGTILPLSFNWITNFKIFGIFVLGFLFLGGMYVLLWTFVLVGMNFKKFRKEFKIEFKHYKNIFYTFCFFGVAFALLSLLFNIYIGLIGILMIIFPLLFIFSKSVEESCMIRSVKPKDLTEGDWLYEDIFIGGRKIKSDWEGLSMNELKFIQKKSKKNILIKQGIPFTPSFLLGFLLVVILSFI